MDPLSAYAKEKGLEEDTIIDQLEITGDVISENFKQYLKSKLEGEHCQKKVGKIWNPVIMSIQELVNRDIYDDMTLHFSRIENNPNSININLKPKYKKYGLVYEIENGLKASFNYVHAGDQLFHFNVNRYYQPSFLGKNFRGVNSSQDVMLGTALYNGQGGFALYPKVFYSFNTVDQTDFCSMYSASSGFRLNIPMFSTKFEIGYKEQHKQIANRYLLDNNIKSGFNQEQNSKLPQGNQNLGAERLVNHEPYFTVCSDLTLPKKLGNLYINLNNAWGSQSTESRINMHHKIERKLLLNQFETKKGVSENFLKITSDTKFGKIINWSRAEELSYTENDKKEIKYTKGYSFNNFYLNEHYRGFKRIGENYNKKKEDNKIVISEQCADDKPEATLERSENYDKKKIAGIHHGLGHQFFLSNTLVFNLLHKGPKKTQYKFCPFLHVNTILAPNVEIQSKKSDEKIINNGNLKSFIKKNTRFSSGIGVRFSFGEVNLEAMYNCQIFSKNGDVVNPFEIRLEKS